VHKGIKKLVSSISVVLIGKVKVLVWQKEKKVIYCLICDSYEVKGDKSSFK
jgi:hypothetical protein